MPVTLHKQLGAIEDLAIGVGAENQTRNGTNVVVHKLHLPLAVETVEELDDIDTDLYTYARVVDSNGYIDYMYKGGVWAAITSLVFSTDEDLVAGAPIASAAVTDWSKFVGLTATTLRNNGAWPPSNTTFNVQTFVISTASPSSGLGVVHYDLGGGHYAIRSIQGGGTRIDWFEDLSSAPAMAAFSAFNVAGFSPRVLSNVINVTSTASTYTVPYWGEGLTVQFEPATTATITVTPTVANSKPVTFVLKNENITLILPGAGAFRGTGQRITALAIGTSGQWVLQSSGSYYHPDGIIGSAIGFTGANSMDVTVGPTGSGATFTFAALDGLEHVKAYHITVYAAGQAESNTIPGPCYVRARVCGKAFATGPYQAAAASYNPAATDLADCAALNTITVPNLSNGMLYARRQISETFEPANGNANTSLWLIGYDY